MFSSNALNTPSCPLDGCLTLNQLLLWHHLTEHLIVTYQSLAVVVSFAIGLPLTKVVIRIAKRYGWMDVPSDERRVHHSPVPRLGGVAIFFSTAIALVVVLGGYWYLTGVHPQVPFGPMLPGVVLGSSAIFLTGLLDDLRGVAPRFKLVAQSAAALAVVAYGLNPHSFGLAPGMGVLNIGWLGIPLVVFWIVGITNAFNLIDGVDGLAGSFALVGLTTCIAAEALLHGSVVLTLTLAVVGAVLAFLRYNNAPARIFLGDSGSMTIGFFLAIQSVVAGTGTDGTVYFLVPLVALAFPITDTFVAIARRFLRSHPISRADGRHIHHQLLSIGLSARRTVDILSAVFSAVAVVGLSIVFAPPRLTFALMVATAILGTATLVYAIRYLQYSEFLQVGRSVTSVLRSARMIVRHKILADELITKIQQAETWEAIESLLAEHALETCLVQVELVAGKKHFIGPEAQMIAPANRLPWRLDYRMGVGDETREEVLLRVWSVTPEPGIAHGSAERFAVQVGPAIERWIQQHPHRIPFLVDSRPDPQGHATRAPGSNLTTSF